MYKVLCLVVIVVVFMDSQTVQGKSDLRNKMIHNKLHGLGALWRLRKEKNHNNHLAGAVGRSIIRITKSKNSHSSNSHDDHKHKSRKVKGLAVNYIKHINRFHNFTEFISLIFIL